MLCNKSINHYCETMRVFQISPQVIKLNSLDLKTEERQLKKRFKN